MRDRKIFFYSVKGTNLEFMTLASSYLRMFIWSIFTRNAIAYVLLQYTTNFRPVVCLMPQKIYEEIRKKLKGRKGGIIRGNSIIFLSERKSSSLLFSSARSTICENSNNINLLLDKMYFMPFLLLPKNMSQHKLDSRWLCSMPQCRWIY